MEEKQPAYLRFINDVKRLNPHLSDFELCVYVFTHRNNDFYNFVIPQLNITNDELEYLKLL